ncbi:NUDIX domain-containing protein [Patescibacteria group bacterium]|nr:MAG: NUDIX domain-containing protein [Patescibacteria group bacterium]
MRPASPRTTSSNSRKPTPMPNATHKRRKPSRSSPRSARRRPGERFEREVSAGGLVFKRTPRGVRFALMKDSYGKWAFPKGHVEPDETREQAAARETLEELGLDEVRLLEYLGAIDIWFRDRFEKKGTLIHKDIHYFLFETAEDAELHPDPEQHAYDARWVAPGKLIESSSYKDMEPVIKRALGFISALHRG